MPVKINKIIATTIIIFGILFISYFIYYNKVDEFNKRVSILENVEIPITTNIYSCECVNQTIIQEVVNISLLDELNSTIQKQTKEIEKNKKNIERLKKYLFDIDKPEEELIEEVEEEILITI